MNRRVSLVTFFFYIAASAACASPVFVSSLPVLMANDEVNWSQLGNDGSVLAASFSAVSSDRVLVDGSLSGPNSQISVVCPAVPSCSWAPASPGSFNAGDSLIWTSNGQGLSNGPLIVSFSSAVFGGGAFVQEDTPGPFTTQITAYNGTTLVLSGSASSDATGDPVFLGVLNIGAADITSEVFSILSCSGFGCDTADFAVDSLHLNTAVPEPSFVLPISLFMIPLLLFQRLPKGLRGGVKRLLLSLLASAAVASFGISAAWAQGASPSSGLPLWRYQVIAAQDGAVYSGAIVGQSPFNHGARTTTIPVALIPVIVNIMQGGTTYTFDPTASDDDCLGVGNTGLSLMEQSPLFNDANFTFNGVDVGHTQYADAFLRGEFWQYVQATGNSYHLLLTTTVMPALTISVDGGASGNSTASAQFIGYAGQCGTPTGTVNLRGYLGVVNDAVVDPLLQQYMANNGINPSQLAFFVMYNAAVSFGSATGFPTFGYHSAVGTQTYALADFENRQEPLVPNLYTTVAASHELNEWLNDPYVENATPPWGSSGGCYSSILEVGDPLAGVITSIQLMPPVTMPNGFTYNLQELAYFSWFFGGPSLGAGGVYSSNGTFTGPAKLCPPGGTN